MISVVIPAYNEATRIGAQLEALEAQRPGEDYEVLVADNGSTDDTVTVVERWTGRLPLRVVDASARRGQAAARNVAVRAARGDLLVFVDADDVVLPGFLDAWCDLDPGVELASGPVIFFRPDQEPPRDASRAPRRLPVHMGFRAYALGANFGVRRELFERGGGFDEDMPPAEDVELSWRLQRMGAELTFVPGAIVGKRLAPTTCATLRQYYHYGYRDPFLYREFRSEGVPPPPIWPTVRSYLGLVARLPVLFRSEPRRRWAQQFGRRAGRLAGSRRAGAWYP